MNEEYEYSFKVKSIKEFIDYCKKNKYRKIDEYKQVRTLYKNGGKIMARITKNIYEDRTVEILNFKDDNLNNNILSVSRESLDLHITKENKKFVKSLISILELNDEKVLKRHRVVYKKGHVKFEIDEYTVPKMKVVAIEGDKEQVDRVYKELDNVIIKNKLD